MRWFRIRKANIPEENRALYERFGATVISLALTSGIPQSGVAPQLDPLYNLEGRKKAAEWLTEQYDRAERKETWSMTMEMAITVFVGVELLLSVLSVAWHYGWLP